MESNVARTTSAPQGTVTTIKPTAKIHAVPAIHALQHLSITSAAALGSSVKWALSASLSHARIRNVLITIAIRQLATKKCAVRGKHALIISSVLLRSAGEIFALEN